MGAADVVPGVSGGTIAFITGIYEEFIHSLKSINLDALKALRSGGIKGFWDHINGSFLLFLFIGIGTSIVSLAKVFTYLLKTYPILVWAFFFGLIIASVWLVGKQIKKWSLGTVLAILIGTAVAYYITVASPAETPETWWFIMLAGMIAICAMILPGISGSFILLLMGKYAFIVGSISDHDFKVLGLFAIGCIAGLLSFSHLLSWAFKKFHNTTIALLTGFMVGSLNKVWPWKETISTRVNSHGETVPFIQESILPAGFEGEPQVGMAVLFIVIGIGLIVSLELFAAKRGQK